jgi:hypothetical protein
VLTVRKFVFKNAGNLMRLLWIPLAASLSQGLLAAAAPTFHFRCEANGEAEAGQPRVFRVQTSRVSPGPLVFPKPLSNSGSWQFDGRTSIAFAVPSKSDGFGENFTWEGFFLSPSSNKFLPESGIADRLVTQFAFDKGDWTRLAIGLVADRKGLPRLCIELEGFDGRTFGRGDRVVAADRWHHFALVHEGTASAARIHWYLDYELTGEVLLGGQANQNTMRPPGSAPFTIGARLRTGQLVNRGFQGLIDEVRLTPRPLKVEEFLRVDSASFSKRVLTLEPTRVRDDFWSDRHRWAIGESASWRRDGSGPSSIDTLSNEDNSRIDDAAFFRRLSLVVRGRIPTWPEVEQFLKEDRIDKRARAIDRLLASPEWADGWVGYWQDVLAENPSVVFPTLNNSGAFRQWLFESFRDNTAFDQFAAELILMQGSGASRPDYDGPASFAIATGNDVPMAMRAHVVMKAFAAVDLRCARCHDSPVDEFRQADLFQLAAYLNGGPIKVPASSVAAVGKANVPGAITTSLKAGQQISPANLTSHWLRDVAKVKSLNPVESGSRAHLAALATSPHNSRFSDVIVNRVWKRYFGRGLVEPVDQWNSLPEMPHPELLRWLSADLVESGYDLKHLARRILNSESWQATRTRRQRMSAEQIVDSLFIVVGKEFRAETLGVHATDPGAVQLPQPRRAWQFAALPNERDRPALGMPVSQTIVDVMQTFGWSGSRQQPRSEREETTSALQPLLMFNGLMSQRVVRLSEQSAITELCLRDDSVATLVNRLFLSVLGRLPDRVERDHFVAFLRPDFETRLTGKPARPVEPLSTFQPDWRKHLEAEQTSLMFAAQQRVAAGERPTARLTSEFRERVEDVVWALVNSPEFVVIP